MELLSKFIEVFLHVDRHLIELTQSYPTAIYVILFLILFCETGLVVMPFLPGDSLLFAVGALAALGGLHIWQAFVLLAVAAILGDAVNYWVGRRLGPKIFREENVRFLNHKHLDQTYRFYEKYGKKTIVLARFVPFVRTFAPFVAGISRMNYATFAFSNLFGGLLWVSICLFAGYFWGNLPFVKQNFSLVILGIIFVSVLPAAFQLLSARRASKIGSSRPVATSASPETPEV